MQRTVRELTVVVPELAEGENPESIRDVSLDVGPPRTIMDSGFRYAASE